VSVTEKTSPKLKALLRDSTTAKVTVGIHKEQGSKTHGNATNIDVGVFHEFGLGHVPQRSFVRGWVDSEISSIVTVISSPDVKKALVSKQKIPLERVALTLEAMMRARIVRGIRPELSAQTIARKGSATPLIDTGQLVNSISSRVKIK